MMLTCKGLKNMNKNYYGQHLLEPSMSVLLKLIIQLTVCNHVVLQLSPSPARYTTH